MPKSAKTTKRDLHQNIKDNGWKQGSCFLLPCENLPVGKIDLPSGLYIIITQDCDLLLDSLEKEPYVELLHAKEIIFP
jgi:hypothetical protein